MSTLLTIFKKLYHTFAFLCVLGVALIFIFSVDIPVYDDEPFTDGNGITWIKNKGVINGYQVIESEPSTYNLKVFELDKDKKPVVVANNDFKIELPLASPLQASDLSLYDGQKVMLQVQLKLR
ncbi:hypothetical protein ACSZND_12620 [Aeromonas hydrophila]|uniref:hypothetical protein n=1 Tax=Aeromonas TaxID=642 RepID=UPI0012D34212|nr:MULTISPECIES: hypothetical protein [Aeromonas]QSR43230.1 hypothetical protein HUI95_09325 [Aeromonas dhakensis]HDX8383477.1 hypothetical protein [Aeromonas hydrophila]